MILYGSGMSESDHALAPQRADAARRRPGGTLEGNRHIQAPKETPLANLMLSIANKFGCEIDKFGLSTRPVCDLR